MTFRLGLAAALTCGAALFQPAAAQNPALLHDRDSWETLSVPGERESVFAFSRDGTLRLEADAAVAFLYRMLNKCDGAHHRLSWRWRVDRPAETGPLAHKGGDDRAVAVHLWFSSPGSAEPVHGGLARLWGYPEVSHAITYVWGAIEPAESMFPNPYAEQAVIFVLEDGRSPTGTWIMEDRDLPDDIRRAFGSSLTSDDIAYIALSADSEDAGSRSLAQVADLKLAQGDCHP